jgi:serine/threonine protein phosphatase PrpC
LLIEEASSEEVSKKLVNAANDAGGTDNITAVIARFGT